MSNGAIQWALVRFSLAIVEVAELDVVALPVLGDFAGLGLLAVLGDTRPVQPNVERQRRRR